MCSLILYMLSSPVVTLSRSALHAFADVHGLLVRGCQCRLALGRPSGEIRRARVLCCQRDEES